MTREQIDRLWFQAMRQSAEAGEQFSRYHFAAAVADAALAARMPLTDAELADLWHQANGQHYRFARLIEKTHDIKGRR